MTTSKGPSAVHSVRLKESQEEFLHSLQAGLMGTNDLSEVDWSLREFLGLLEQNQAPFELLSEMICEHVKLQKAARILADLESNTYFQSESSFKTQIEGMRLEFKKKLKEYEQFKRQCLSLISKSLEL